MSRTRPWYGLLYYLLGAPGSFLLWIVVFGGMFLTYQEALLFLLNAEPASQQLTALATPQPTWNRWVKLQGVVLSLDLAPVSSNTETHSSGSNTLLLGNDNPNAQQWRDLALQLDGRLRPQTDPTDATVKELWELVQGACLLTPPPHAALVVVKRPQLEPAAPDVPTEPKATPGQLPPDTFEQWRQRTLQRARTLRSNIQTDAHVSGLLMRLPSSRMAHYKDTHAIDVLPYALVTAYTPNRLAAQLFGLFSLLFILLVLGLFALRKPKEN